MKRPLRTLFNVIENHTIRQISCDSTVVNHRKYVSILKLFVRNQGATRH